MELSFDRVWGTELPSREQDASLRRVIFTLFRGVLQGLSGPAGLLEVGSNCMAKAPALLKSSGLTVVLTDKPCNDADSK
jgi:hypothetical protein